MKHVNESSAQLANWCRNGACLCVVLWMVCENISSHCIRRVFHHPHHRYHQPPYHRTWLTFITGVTTTSSSTRRWCSPTSSSVSISTSPSVSSHVSISTSPSVSSLTPHLFYISSHSTRIVPLCFQAGCKFKQSLTLIDLFALSHWIFLSFFIYCVSFVFLCRLFLHSFLCCRNVACHVLFCQRAPLLAWTNKWWWWWWLMIML